MPRAGRGHGNEGNEEDGPSPLKGKWNAVRPLVLARLEAAQDTGGDELTDDKTHVGETREINTQDHGKTFRGISRGRRRKYAPWKTGEGLAHAENGCVRGKEGDEDETREGDEGA